MTPDYKNITKSNYKVITPKLLCGFLAIFLLGFSSFGCNSAADSLEDQSPKENIPAAEFIARADESFANRQDLKNVREGIDLLKRAKQAERRNYEAAWKLSRLYFYLGKYSREDKESEQALQNGIEAAKVATRIETEKPEGYFWLGANLGAKVKRNPITGLGSLKDIREAMEKVISLNPAFEGGDAYDVLAQIELQTDTFGGSAQKAIEYLEKAQSLEKNNTFLYLHLGEAYLTVDRNAEGKKQLEIVVNMNPPAGHEFEHQEAVEEAKKVLANRF